MLRIKNALYHISKRFTVGPLTINVEEGKHVALIGESGCGKTTLLKIVYGLYDLDEGFIQWKDEKVTGPEDNLIPGMPFAKYLSQDFDLMPFTSVEENINKYLSRLEPEASKARTNELMEVVEMSAFAKVKVKTLSGGQKQRVALAQTLAKEPELLLLDEPFSHIDNFRKNKLRRRLFAYLKKQHITCLVATHDSTDVLAYMDETIVMKQGKVVVHEETISLFKKPPSYYVGSLFDDINEVPRHWFHKEGPKKEKLLVYPHQLAPCRDGFEVSVSDSYFMGSHYIVTAYSGDTMVLFNTAEAYPRGAIVKIGLIN